MGDLSNDVLQLTQSINSLASAFVTSRTSVPSVATYEGQARASAQAALTSQTNAATSATNTSSSATNAANQAANAAASASAASTSETNAAASASSAATDATNAGTDETNASGSATAAGNSNTAAQGYNSRVQTLAQVSPVVATEAVTGLANTVWGATSSITAPCAGWVFSIGSLNLDAQATGAYTAVLFLNSTNMSSDETYQSQKHMGFVAVTAGEVVTAELQVSSGTTAPGVSGAAHLLTFFIPGQV